MEPSRQLLIKIEYEGTHYKGWQIQPNQLTIQQQLTDVFQRICQQSVHITAVSRTDSGVHARGQMATLRVPSRIPLRKIFISANSLLPDDIAITDLVQVDDSYFIRSDCTGKRYIYNIHRSPIQLALGHQTHLWIKRPIDYNKIKIAMKQFIGLHNYSAYQGKGCQQVQTDKRITEVSCRIEKNASFEKVAIIIEGSGFLKNMIRIMVGTLLEIGHSKREILSIQNSLKTGNREDAGITLPAKGLILDEIFFSEDPMKWRTTPTWDME